MFTPDYLYLATALFAYMTVWFVVSLYTKRNDTADTAWGLGFVTLAWLSLAVFQEFHLRSILVTGLVTIWGTRLAWHIYLRNRHKTEDHRYLEMSKNWGKWFALRAYAQVFLLQGVLLFLIAQSFLHIANSPASSLTIWDVLGVSIWILGFYFESTGDAQLARFKKNPENAGKIMQTGLWQYTRHPNYFGEVTQWWGIYVLALATANGWQTIISPLTITILICFVSGVPLLEKKYAGRADFAAYKKSTSIFFPWPPRK